METENKNYVLIHDEEKLQEFINFLPELQANESYFLILIARRKWFTEAEIKPAVKLKREAVTKERIISTIRQWETAVGTLKCDGVDINQNNLGVYIGYNPKNQHAACFQLIKTCLDVIKDNRNNINVKSMANDIIQSSNGTKHFMDINVDIKELENYRDIMDFIKSVIKNDNALTFVKTSGGFHCLVRLSMLEGNKTWYPQIKAHKFKSDLNIMSNDLMPIPSCRQGQFIPYFIM